MYSYENLKVLVERYNKDDVELSTGMGVQIRFLKLIKNQSSFLNLIEDMTKLGKENIRELSDLVKD